MPKRLSRKRAGRSDDPNQAAFRIVRQIEDAADPAPRPAAKVLHIPAKAKNPAAVALGRKGGLKSAAGRLEKIDPMERHRIASNAARARWAKKRGDG
jgi:hypothetical protein